MPALPINHSLYTDELVKRALGFGRRRRGGSTWNRTGRWALAGVLIGIFVLFVLFFIIAAITARRRRAAGQQPARGTGWVLRMPGLREAPAGTFNPPPGPPPGK